MEGNQTEEGAATNGDVSAPPALPEGASKVIYINNLNEKIKIDVMKISLKNIFRNYGKVLGITAHGNVRMRGQAFVTLDSLDQAVKAVKEVQQFPLYGRPMQLAFAKTRSDVLVKSTTPDEFDKHKEERLEHKKISRKGNPLRRKELAKKIAAKKATGEDPTAAAAAAGPTTAPGRRIVQMPDEYLPPNKILFVQNLPDDTTKESLEALFSPYPNLTEVRTIPGRKNIAFVEFTDDSSSGVAREALHNMRLGQGDAALKIKVTFAKQG
ncbi:hypothetical protein T439DRAFT_293813 [Meredithblackwellia eburnea MCA 4105]